MLATINDARIDFIDYMNDADSAAVSGRKANNGIPQSTKMPSEMRLKTRGLGSEPREWQPFSKTMAETRARAEIARQMNSMVWDMIRDYVVASEVDPYAAQSFQEAMTRALSESKLQGAKVIIIEMDENDNYWVAMPYSKSAAAAKINRPKPPQNSGFPQWLPSTLKGAGTRRLIK